MITSCHCRGCLVFCSITICGVLPIIEFCVSPSTLLLFSIAFICMLFHHETKIQAWSSYFFLALGADFSQAKIQAWFSYFSVPCFGSRFFSFFSLSFVSGKSKVMSLFKTTIVAEDIPQAVIFAGSNIHFLKFDSNFAI